MISEEHVGMGGKPYRCTPAGRLPRDARLLARLPLPCPATCRLDAHPCLGGCGDSGRCQALLRPPGRVRLAGVAQCPLTVSDSCL
jgi:hypothetical protein